MESMGDYFLANKVLRLHLKHLVRFPNHSRVCQMYSTLRKTQMLGGELITQVEVRT